MKMNHLEIRQSFSKRLYDEFQRMGLPMNSPTEITRTINRKLPQLSVTPQAVRKWLFHGVFPSQDKIMMLADWLGVSAQWLRYGTGERIIQPTKIDNALGTENSSPSLMLFGYEYVRLVPIIDALAKLSARNLRIVEGLVGVLTAEENTNHKQL
jgi:hypothetical protein